MRTLAAEFDPRSGPAAGNHGPSGFRLCVPIANKKRQRRPMGRVGLVRAPTTSREPTTSGECSQLLTVLTRLQPAQSTTEVGGSPLSSRALKRVSIC